MKKLNKYIMLFVAALALVSCVDDGIDNPTLKAEAGDEVQFGLSLPSSRTVYGPETDNAYPIYWVNNDKVFIFSPQCLDGYRGAEYAVSVNGETQNYATSITKTGDIGVQWGNNETADFYSLYPSGLYGLSDDGKIAKGIVVNTSQNIFVTQNAGGTRKIKSDMEDCLLYAKKLGVQSGTTVELQYSPITTVFMLTLSVGGESVEQYTIQSISLIAPEGTDIAGKFGINVADGTFAEWSETKDNIVSAAISDASSGGFLTLTKGESVEVPLFIAPIRNENVDNGAFSVNGWTIEVKANGKTYSKTLGDLTVVPGQIHKIALPALSSNKAQEWDVATWMVNIPRNVYLSEVSIPGSWNSINNDFQKMGDSDKLTIDNQYKKGVRAFHLDTRWKAQYNLGGYGTFQKVLGLGVADGGDKGSSWSGTITDGDKYMKGSGTPLVEEIIAQLVSYIKETPEEYMVLVCTFAQESVQHNGANGWINAITEICNNSAYADYILPASEVTPNTLVGDAIGKIVVIIGASEEITSTTTPSSTLAENSSCFFSYLPMELKSTMFVGTDNKADSADNEDQLWYTTTTTNDTGITLYNSHAQLTSSTGSAITNHERGYVPSVAQRNAVLEKIVGYSLDNTKAGDNRKHNKWLYLGLGGGYVSGGGDAGLSDYSGIASKYNTWIDDKVKEMGTTPAGATEVVPYYPVGIVMMNQVESHESTVKDILLMNQKYRMQYDASKPENYTPPTDIEGPNEE